MYQLGGTIKETLDKIQRTSYVLPAIQREFVWKPDQICKLFDSLMQEYPFGTFLYWKVDAKHCSKYKFYSFVCNYHEQDSPHCPDLPIFHDTELTAVLDGQQRLTALNIGLAGSLAWKISGKWKNNPNAYPVRHLYLDLLAAHGDSDESGEKFRFQFLTEDRLAAAEETECWFKVAFGFRNSFMQVRDSGGGGRAGFERDSESRDFGMVAAKLSFQLTLLDSEFG